MRHDLDAVGPNVQNFADVVATLAAAGGLRQVADTTELAGWIGEMLRDPVRRAKIGEAGRKTASADAGLPTRVAGLLADLVRHGPTA